MQNVTEIIKQAKLYHSKSNLKEAENLYLSVLKIDEDNEEINYLLGILYDQINDNQKSIYFLKKSIEIQPDNPNYYFTLGEIILKNTDSNKLKDIFIESVKASPNSDEAHFNLANSLKMIGNYQLAIEHYKNAIMLNPKHDRAYNNLANTYMEHLLYKEAAETYRELISINPNFPGVRNNLANSIQLVNAINVHINANKLINDFSDIEKIYDENELISSYIILLKKSLTDSLRMNKLSDEYDRLTEGLSWPVNAETMIGIKRLNNLHFCLSQVIKNNISGDFIETGVWKGGATILMRGVLKAYQITDRKVWVADSFEGLPVPDDKYPYDRNSTFHNMKPLKVSIDNVRENFEKYNLLDEQVRFLKGWFKDTLPIAPIEKIAVLRLDGDMYESTMDALVNLYPKLSVGGYIIVDDYAIKSCNKAIENYRSYYKIQEPIHKVDYSGIYWQKG